MKFAATLLFATASASLYGQQVAVEQAYEAPAAKMPAKHMVTKSYATQWKKLDVDAVVTELNRRTEQRIRAVRDETFATIRGITVDTRDVADELISQFEADILALREALMESWDAKRAELDASDDAIRAIQGQIVVDLDAEIEMLNAKQEELLAEILLADMYYDHTRIAKLLSQDGKQDALTWEGQALRAPSTVADSYLSYNAREPAERVYNELYTAKADLYAPSYGHGYGQGYGYGYGY